MIVLLAIKLDTDGIRESTLSASGCDTDADVDASIW